MLSRLKRAASDPGMAIAKLANIAFRRAAGGDRRPGFHDIDVVKPELRTLDQNFSIIRSELDAVLAEKAVIPRYHEITARETYISGTIEPRQTLASIHAANAAWRPAKKPDQMSSHYRAHGSYTRHRTSVLFYS